MEAPFRRTSLIALFFLSAIPLSFLIAFERSKFCTHFYEYHSHGFYRESCKWDNINRRFLVSFLDGGVGQIPVPENHLPGAVLEEQIVIKDPDVAGNSSLGILIDRPRTRLLVVIADLFGNHYSALAAYDLNTWHRVFLTQLSGPGDEKSFADDVAVDEDGNAYITDAKGNKIWKVGVDGELITIIKSHLFNQRKQWYYNLVGLNGIVYHPKGFLLVIHTSTGDLFKIDTMKEEVRKVEITKGSLFVGDGLELLSPTKLVVAGTPSGRLVESLDGWETASVIGRYMGPMHRVATSATMKDGKVYLSHVFGGGIPKKKHVITEAVFSSLS
ncbi:uncharacterized protein LOC143853260 [Tasmannia lanceolata]|uniref:uncharacterized protein LOC143853260 n=1 Tax=Tasmannia lanceolata TaxID=3420 RepID=UPI0040646085